MNLRPALRLLALPVLLGACHVDVPEVRTEPPADKMSFPAGLAVDPGGRLLYVSTGNGDLKYGGGSLMAFDLERFECAVDLARGMTPDPKCDRFPVANDIKLVRDEHGFPTAGCVRDPIDPQVIDCVESPFALSNSTVRVGNFAGTMRLRKTGETTRTLYLAVRGDPSVTWVDIDTAKLMDKADATGHVDRPGVLDCFDADTRAGLETRDGYDQSTNTTDIPPRCDKSHLVQTYTCDGTFGCVEGDNDIPHEPFNLLIDEGTGPTGAPYSRLLVSHLSAGQVTLVDLAGTPHVADVSPPFFAADQAGRHGVFGLARIPAGDAPLFYLTSNLSAAISTFRVTDTAMGPTVVPSAAFSTAGPFSSGADGRDIIGDPNSPRAFFTQNAPPSLAVLDVQLGEPQSHGLPTSKVTDTVEICQTASHMGLRQSAGSGPDGSGFKSKVYVACFTSNQLMVVDPDRPGVDETILVGRGPTEIAFNFSGLETPAAERMKEPTHGRRAYVTHYGEWSIGVIDLQPGSPTENRLIARIGLPQPPMNP